MKAEDIANLLNFIFDSDPYFMESFITLQLPCNEKIAGHPFIQVRKWPKANKYTCGLLGLLNGLCNDDELVNSVYDELTGKLIKFEHYPLDHYRKVTDAL